MAHFELSPSLPKDELEPPATLPGQIRSELAVRSALWFIALRWSPVDLESGRDALSFCGLQWSRIGKFWPQADTWGTNYMCLWGVLLHIAAVVGLYRHYDSIYAIGTAFLP